MTRSAGSAPPLEDVDPRIAERLRYRRDVFTNGSLLIFGSGVLAVLFAVTAFNPDALGLGPRPTATAAVFLPSLLGAGVLASAAYIRHRELTR